MNKNVIDGEYKLSEWIRQYNKGAFNGSNLYIMQDAGWHDWFCREDSLKRRFDALAPKLLQVAKSPMIDTERTYVFFKNNCPAAGPLYDSFSICDIYTGKVLFWVGHIKKGCYGDSRSGWDVDALVDGEWRSILEYAKWTEVKRYFKI